MKAPRVAVCACSLLLPCCAVRATLLNIGTGVAHGWTVSAGGAQDVAPYDLGGGTSLSITSNGFSTGTPVPGLSLGTFDGYWVGNLPFYMPANAVNPRLQYNNLTGDDRVVLELNGVPIGNAGYSSGPGAMTLTDGGANVPYQFAGNYTQGAVTDGFILGAPNLLQVIINNTDSGIQGSPTNIGASDGTDFGVQGSVSYFVAPEPMTFALVLVGSAGLLIRRRRPAIG